MYFYSDEKRTLTVPRYYSMHDSPATIKYKGKTLFKDLAATHGRGMGRCNVQAKWPIRSMGAAVRSEQRSDYEEFDRKNGVATRYVDNGLGWSQPEFRNPTHRRNYLKLHKIHDNDGFD